MKFVGVDGCKTGWATIIYNGKNYEWAGVFKELTALSNILSPEDRVFIDIPIGLGSKSVKRTIDDDLRKLLKGKSSTVFNIPTRNAVHAKNYEIAKQINEKIEAKKLSIQSWCITPKIREMDRFLNGSSKKLEQWNEAHPEYAFLYLNQNKSLSTKKSQKEGKEERLGILTKYNSQIPKLYTNILQQTLRKDVKRDDILDALALAVFNKEIGENIQYLENKPLHDEKGIRMRLVIGRQKKP